MTRNDFVYSWLLAKLQPHRHHIRFAAKRIRWIKFHSTFDFSQAKLILNMALDRRFSYHKPLSHLLVFLPQQHISNTVTTTHCSQICSTAAMEALTIMSFCGKEINPSARS